MSKRSGLTTQMNLTQCSFVSRRRSCIVATRQNRRSQHITFPYPIPISTFPRGITPRARRRVARIIVGGRQFSANNLGIIAGNVYDDNGQRISGGDGFVAVKLICGPVRVPVTSQGLWAQKGSLELKKPVKVSGSPSLSPPANP